MSTGSTNIHLCIQCIDALGRLYPPTPQVLDVPTKTIVIGEVARELQRANATHRFPQRMNFWKLNPPRDYDEIKEQTFIDNFLALSAGSSNGEFTFLDPSRLLDSYAWDVTGVHIVARRKSNRRSTSVPSLHNSCQYIESAADLWNSEVKDILTVQVTRQGKWTVSDALYYNSVKFFKQLRRESEEIVAEGMTDSIHTSGSYEDATLTVILKRLSAKRIVKVKLSLNVKEFETSAH